MPPAMRVIERTADLDRARKRLVRRQRPFGESRGQCLPLEAFHDQKVDLSLTTNVV
jgi:hypothetical protein